MRQPRCVISCLQAQCLTTSSRCGELAGHLPPDAKEEPGKRVQGYGKGELGIHSLSGLLFTCCGKASTTIFGFCYWTAQLACGSGPAAVETCSTTAAAWGGDLGDLLRRRLHGRWPEASCPAGGLRV